MYSELLIVNQVPGIEYSSSGPCIVPVADIVPIALYIAGEIAWHRWEQPLASVRGAVPVAAIVPVFPSIVPVCAL